MDIYPFDVAKLRELGTSHHLVPRLVEYARDLSASEDHLLRVHLDNVDFKDWHSRKRPMSIAMLAACSKMDARTIRSANPALERKGYIKLERRNSQENVVIISVDKFAALSERVANEERNVAPEFVAPGVPSSYTFY